MRRAASPPRAVGRDTAAPRAGKVLDPNWGSLYKEFAGDEEKLIAQVDCQHDGASLCEKYGVDALPTLKFGAADELAFDSISNLFETCAAKDVEARPKSFEFILRSLETEMNAWRRSLPSPSPGNDKKVETGKQEENPKSDENGLKERE